MKKINRLLKFAVWFLMLASLIGSAGCEGTPTREAVDDTVEELSGKKNVERMEQMKQDLDGIQNQQKARYEQLKEAGESNQ